MKNSGVALITGGVQGLGAATAKALRNEGYSVAVTNRTESEKTAAFTRETGFPHYAWDVSDFDACAKGVANVERDLGPVDVLVNNAGVTQDVMFHKMKLEQWRSVLHVDLDSMFNMTRQVISGMRTRGFGRIINISSVNGLKGQIG